MSEVTRISKIKDFFRNWNKAKTLLVVAIILVIITVLVVIFLPEEDIPFDPNASLKSDSESYILPFFYINKEQGESQILGGDEYSEIIPIP